MKKNKNKGFTLIELLVVISIISLLSSVVLASLNTARSKARDARRLSDIHEINTAISLYIFDKGHAPYLQNNADCTGGPNDRCSTSDRSPTCSGADNVCGKWFALETDLAPYISRLPRDPQHGAGSGAAFSQHYEYLGEASMMSYCNLIIADTGDTSCKGVANPYAIYTTLEKAGPRHGVQSFGSL